MLVNWVSSAPKQRECLDDSTSIDVSCGLTSNSTKRRKRRSDSEAQVAQVADSLREWKTMIHLWVWVNASLNP